MSRTRTKTARRNHALHVETLEGRQLMAADARLFLVGPPSAEVLADLPGPAGAGTGLLHGWSSKDTKPAGSPQGDSFVTAFELDPRRVGGRAGIGSFDVEAQSPLALKAEGALEAEIGLGGRREVFRAKAIERDATGKLVVERFRLEFTSIARETKSDGTIVEHVKFRFVELTPAAR